MTEPDLDLTEELNQPEKKESFTAEVLSDATGRLILDTLIESGSQVIEAGREIFSSIVDNIDI